MLTFDRFDLFCRSFQCFCDQTYPHKELIILSHGTDEYISMLRDYVTGRGRKDVALIGVSSRLPLGLLRNTAIKTCSGDVICQWDDDDLSHPDRIAAQLSAMDLFSSDATVLLENLHLFYDSKQVFWCDWTRSRQDLGLAGTLMIRRESLLSYRSDMSSDEDSQLLFDLCHGGRRLALLGGMGCLYIYTYHGSNTFGRRHHQQLSRHLGLEHATLQMKIQSICRTLEHHAIQPPIDIVDHREDLVWRWDGTRRSSMFATADEATTSVFVVSQGQGRQRGDNAGTTGLAVHRRCSEMGLWVESHCMTRDRHTGHFHATAIPQATDDLTM